MMIASDFDNMTVKDMRGVCRNKGLTGYSRFNRAELVAFLCEASRTPDVVIGDAVVVMTETYAYQGLVIDVTETHVSVMSVSGIRWNVLYSEYVVVRGEARKAQILSESIAYAYVRAENEDALMTEVYAHRAENAGMDFAPFLAHIREHRNAGHVIIGGLWNCCPGNEIGVAVFDDGTKHAVCEACANSFVGTIEKIPGGDVRTCETCESTHIHPITPGAPIPSQDVDPVTEVVIPSVTLNDNMALSAFLTEAERILKPLQAMASFIERVEWENGTTEAEEWTTASKALTNALSDVEWLISYRHANTPGIHS